MKKIILITLLVFSSLQVQAFWGGDIPLLIKIVTNTMRTFKQLRDQTSLLKKQMQGIDDIIRRFDSISKIANPENLDEWKDPKEAARRLERIYYTLPPEFRTEKSDQMARQLSNAMNTASLMMESAQESFESGKQLETKALHVGPAVAEKMAASGIGTLVALESQNQVAQATMVSLITQLVAENGAKEASRIKSQAQNFKSTSSALSGFAGKIVLPEVSR